MKSNSDVVKAWLGRDRIFQHIQATKPSKNEISTKFLQIKTEIQEREKIKLMPGYSWISILIVEIRIIISLNS